MDDIRLREIEARVRAFDDLEFYLDENLDGRLCVGVRINDSPIIIEVRRDLELAAEGDVRFISASLNDLRLLLNHVLSNEQLTPGDITLMEARVKAASPGPWTAFIETDSGQTGCDAIRVSEYDDQPDMYLWVSSELAPSRIFRLVADARQDIPALLTLVR